jgi:hypothetical protein
MCERSPLAILGMHSFSVLLKHKYGIVDSQNYLMILNKNSSKTASGSVTEM